MSPHSSLPPPPPGILVELPLAPFFLKKFRGAYCDINDLPTLDPELYRCGAEERAGLSVLGEIDHPGSCSVMLASGWSLVARACAWWRVLLFALTAPVNQPTWPHIAPAPPSLVLPCSNLVFLKRYTGDVADLGLTFTITDNVLGVAHEVSCMDGPAARLFDSLAAPPAIKLLSRAHPPLPCSCASLQQQTHPALFPTCFPASGGAGATGARHPRHRRQPAGLHPPRRRLPPQPPDPGAGGRLPAVSEGGHVGECRGGGRRMSGDGANVSQLLACFARIMAA